MDDVRRFAAAANMPKQFVEHIIIRKQTRKSTEFELPGDLRTLGKRRTVTQRHNWVLDNTWRKVTKWGTAELGAYFEYGTKRHWLAPRLAKALAWQDKETEEWRFSKGHYISGLPRVMAMHRGYAAGKERMRLQATMEIMAEFGDSTDNMVVAK